MPPKRPLIGKTLLRNDIQTKLINKMVQIESDVGSISRELKILSILFDKCVTSLKKDTLDDFFKKQSGVKNDLDQLNCLIEELQKGLSSLKNDSPNIKTYLESVDVDEITNGHDESIGNGCDVVDKFNALSIGVKTNGNGVLTLNGSGESTSTDSGKLSIASSISLDIISNSSDSTHITEDYLLDLIIDPFNFDPIPPNTPSGRPLEVVVSHVYSPSNFYVQPYKGTEDFLFKVQEEQNKLIAKGVNGFSKIVIGMFCVARYSLDFYWYRAKVIGVNYKEGSKDIIETVRVFYIDYGNSEAVSPDSIMPMAKSIADAKLGAVNCHLTNFYPDGGWPAEATEIMKKIAFDGIYQCYFYSPAPRVSPIGTFSNYPVELFEAKTGKNFIVYINHLADAITDDNPKVNGSEKANGSDAKNLN